MTKPRVGMTFVTPKGFYVYALVDPRDGATFYVGKGKGRRYAAHVAECRKDKGYNLRKRRRIGSILAAGLEVQITILADGLSDTEAYRLERQKLQELPGLTNIAPGSLSAPERAFEHVSDLIDRMRSPKQWAARFVRRRGRKPTAAEIGLYFFVARHLICSRALLRDILNGKEEKIIYA